MSIDPHFLVPGPFTREEWDAIELRAESLLYEYGGYSRAGVMLARLIAEVKRLEAENTSARDVLQQLKRPLAEFPGSLDFGNRQSVADACLALIEQWIMEHAR